MNPLGTIQADAKAAIEAAPWFSGIQVVMDTGDIRNAEETALQSPGILVVVGLPVEVQSEEPKSGNVSFHRAGFIVELIINPLAPHGKNLAEGLGELIAALTGRPVSMGHKGFSTGKAEMVPTEEGLIYWQVPVYRQVLLKP